jgi:hypothetical protein
MNTYGGVYVQTQVFLISALRILGVSGQLHAPAALPLEKGPSGTHWIGGWVGHRASLDDLKK